VRNLGRISIVEVVYLGPYIINHVVLSNTEFHSTVVKKKVSTLFVIYYHDIGMKFSPPLTMTNLHWGVSGLFRPNFLHTHVS
jgi:hypothetical protein